MRRSPFAGLVSLVIFGAILCASVVASAPRLEAQSTPAAATKLAGADYNNRWDVFGGVSFSYFTTTIGHGQKAKLYGGGAQGTAWLSQVAGITAAVRQLSGNIALNPNSAGITSPRISETVFLFGPDVRLFRNPRYAVGTHILVGGTYGIFDTDLKGTPPNLLNLYTNQLAFAGTIGGSFDYNLSPRISVRVITDFAPTYFGSSVQKEFAGQAGVVYKFGSLHSK